MKLQNQFLDKLREKDGRFCEEYKIVICKMKDSSEIKSLVLLKSGKIYTKDAQPMNLDDILDIIEVKKKSILCGEWKKYMTTKPLIGEYRSQSGFIFKPKTIGGITRRWGRAVWEERYAKLVDLDGKFGKVEIEKWLPTRWLDLPFDE